MKRAILPSDPRAIEGRPTNLESNEKRSFGEFITQRRKALGMTQREFADKLFVTDSAVSKWERGMSYPDITLIRDICAILGVSEHELLTAGVDVEARSAEKLAARYRRMARSYKLAQYIIYGGAALICLVCDLADGGGVSWSLVVIASLLTAASLTLLPALAPERMGGAWALGGFTAALLVLYGVICLVYGGSWFAPAALGTLLGCGIVFLPYMLRRVPLPECLSTRKGLVYIGANTLLLFALLGEECLRTRGDWFVVAVLGIVFGLWIVLGPYVLRRLPLAAAVRNHRALLWLGIVTALLVALIPVSGAEYLWNESYPLMALGMLWPWLMLGCLRYLPVSRWYRAAAACAVSAVYLWLAPWGVDAIIKANGWVSITPYDPLHPYNVDFGDWLSAATRGGNIMVTIMALLALAAVALTVIGAKRRK